MAECVRKPGKRKLWRTGLQQGVYGGGPAKRPEYHHGGELRGKWKYYHYGPGGDLELPNYIIQTIYGEVVSAGDIEVGADRYEEAHKGDWVKIKAEPTNDEGRPFLHWKFTIGAVDGMDTKINSREASFAMPDTNLVLTAVYERAATPSNAVVVDEVRGGSVRSWPWIRTRYRFWRTN